MNSFCCIEAPEALFDISNTRVLPNALANGASDAALRSLRQSAKALRLRESDEIFRGTACDPMSSDFPKMVLSGLEASPETRVRAQRRRRDSHGRVDRYQVPMPTSPHVPRLRSEPLASATDGRECALAKVPGVQRDANLKQEPAEVLERLLTQSCEPVVTSCADRQPEAEPREAHQLGIPPPSCTENDRIATEPGNAVHLGSAAGMQAPLLEAVPSASPMNHLLAGAAAGVVSRTVSAPLETLRLQAMTGTARHGGLMLAAQQILQTSGWRGLFRGNGLNVVRAAPQKALDFFAFDLYKDLVAPHFGRSLSTTFLSAGLAGMTSTLCLHPLEVLRSRITCSTGQQSTHLWSATAQIVRDEGFLALYSGLRLSMLAILPEAMITYGMFDALKRRHAKHRGTSEPALLPSIAFGVASAFIGQMVSFPLEAVARRVQVHGHGARSIGIVAIVRQMLLTEGPAALYRGAGVAALRTFPMAFASFSTYELVQAELRRIQHGSEAHGKIENLSEASGCSQEGLQDFVKQLDGLTSAAS